MGNRAAKLGFCFSGEGQSGDISHPAEEGLGHSFCYMSTETTAFRAISGASVSANAATITLLDHPFASAFESSTSFASIPLQLVPRCWNGSSGPVERRFLSGPIERGFSSGPIDQGVHSAPLEKAYSQIQNSKGSKRNLMDEYESLRGLNLQWAQGKAGEDRVHIVVSEEHEWVFVGIYDGFNGPDAPDFLLANLYPSVHNELKSLFWNDRTQSSSSSSTSSSLTSESSPDSRKTSKGILQKCRRKWKSPQEREKLVHDTNPKHELPVDHRDILKALSRALEKTEQAYLDIADSLAMENPELALMGSCVLVMLMKGDDVYLMNVGDSRAVLATDMEKVSVQLTVDHSTDVEDEVQRIILEHPDDSSTMVNDRVKGSLKVTRAFGAGFLKHPKWNDALLQRFKIDYVGDSPYISCSPSLYHHGVTSNDRFLILSSDGLYQYFTNQEAVSEVNLFIAQFPEGDPAQHLVEELLSRAAKKAGIDFYELLEIPQGDRRRYHDDVCVIVISLEGRIWQSAV